jgi:hypothetical protein
VALNASLHRNGRGSSVNSIFWERDASKPRLLPSEDNLRSVIDSLRSIVCFRGSQFRAESPLLNTGSPLLRSLSRQFQRPGSAEISQLQNPAALKAFYGPPEQRNCRLRSARCRAKGYPNISAMRSARPLLKKDWPSVQIGACVVTAPVIVPRAATARPDGLNRPGLVSVRGLDWPGLHRHEGPKHVRQAYR